jgi:hypothetical protein
MDFYSSNPLASMEIMLSVQKKGQHFLIMRPYDQNYNTNCCPKFSNIKIDLILNKPIDVLLFRFHLLKSVLF